MGTLLMCFPSCLCFFLLVILLKFLNKVWWTPIRVQSLMKSQGIEGPPYRFLYGSTTEILNIINAMDGSSRELSHNTFARILPHAYSWVKVYGNNLLNILA